jgi:RNA methyltransferase, TrmH family
MPADQGPRPHELEITSPANPRIKQLAALRRRRSREQAGVTLVEGLAEIELALAAGVRPQALYYCRQLATAESLSLAGQAATQGAEVIHLSRPAFEKVSYREGPDGWLAVVPAVETELRWPGETRQSRRNPPHCGCCSRGRRDRC